MFRSLRPAIFLITGASTIAAPAIAETCTVAANQGVITAAALTVMSARALTESLDLHTFEPESAAYATFRGDKRLDWILLSKDLVFATFDVLPDPVSDHRAIVAIVKFAARATKAPE